MKSEILFLHQSPQVGKVYGRSEKASLWGFTPIDTRFPDEFTTLQHNFKRNEGILQRSISNSQGLNLP